MKTPTFRIFLAAITLTLSLLQFSCEQRDFVKVCDLTTDSVFNINPISVSVSATIIDTGEDGIVVEYGHCWSTEPNPTIDNGKRSINKDALATGPYTSQLTNLLPGTKYYVKAYLNDGVGIKYGEEKSFTTTGFVVPSVELGAVSNITFFSAKITASITAIGDFNTGLQPVTEYGFCWSTSSNNPTLENNEGTFVFGKATAPLTFTSEMSYLKSETAYYLRAYAKNGQGINYTSTSTFNTAKLTIPFSLVTIESGSFMMGANEIPGAAPVHQIYLLSYKMTPREITNREFAQFMNFYGSELVRGGQYIGKLIIKNLEKSYSLRKESNVWVAPVGYENYPVIGVTWYGAYEFCKVYGGRLPTEAEWEYAARGGVNSKAYRYAGGNEAKNVAWYGENPDPSIGRPHAVAGKLPNEIGLYDMSGNVAEWCSDWYSDIYFGVSPQVNPLGPASGDKKVVKGGSWDNENLEYIRPEFRFGKTPSLYDTHVGFRFVKDIEF